MTSSPVPARVAAAGTPGSPSASTDPWALTPEQVEFFDEHGYLVLRDRIDAGLLERLRRASERWMADGLDPDRPRPGDWLFADRLAGPDFVPTYESMVFKSAGDGAPIPWHQDAVHARRHRIFNIDVYLDASVAGEGALHVVPGSQGR